MRQGYCYTCLAIGGVFRSGHQVQGRGLVGHALPKPRKWSLHREGGPLIEESSCGPGEKSLDCWNLAQRRVGLEGVTTQEKP